MFEYLRLHILLKFYILRQHFEKKAKRRWCYCYLPVRADKGFTLAEVLITLTIIGVIAALTIPVLLQSINDQQYKIAWKAAYSVCEQATKRALMDNGGDFTGIFQNATDMKDKLKGYFSYTQECTAGQSTGNCWPAQVYTRGGSSQTLADVPGLVLNNGMFIRFFMHTTQAANATACTETALYSSPGECGMYEVDLNGFKGPNRYGEDIFFIHILSNELAPGGAPKSAYVDCTTNGCGCGAVYLKQ